MSTATQKIKIVKIILNKSIFDENIIDIILQYYWNILDCKKKILINWIKINIKKINWGYLSKNLNAIDLLKERIEYENSLTNEELYQLQNKINRYGLCCNPSIFEDEQMPII